MGAAHFFSVFEEPILSKKKYGGAPIMRPFVFFLRRPFSQKKKIWATFLLNLYFFCMVTTICACQIIWGGIFWSYGRSAHFPPIFFLLKRLFSQKKNNGRCTHQFFFSRPWLISLAYIGLKILSYVETDIEVLVSLFFSKTFQGRGEENWTR